MSNFGYPVESNQKFTLADEVLLQRFEDKALLLDLEAERVYQLNDTGARIIELLSEGYSFGTIVATLKESYIALPVDLETQAYELISELITKGLVIQTRID